VKPSIAVVIPAYQAVRFIHEALESVATQSLRAHEIVVVDDGSTDGTSDSVTSWSTAAGVPVTIIRKENGGAGSARNLGLAAVSSKRIAFLDADDRYVPHALARLSSALDVEPDALVSYGAMRTFIDVGESGDDAPHRAMLAKGPIMLISSALIERRAFIQLGPFQDGNFSAVDWFARLIELGPAAGVAVSDVVGERRIHSRNTSTIETNLIEEYAKILKASLDRRRAR
jgi:glycosyltransferase involved in cell wall biosynthesis